MYWVLSDRHTASSVLSRGALVSNLNHLHVYRVIFFSFAYVYVIYHVVRCFLCIVYSASVCNTSVVSNVNVLYMLNTNSKYMPNVIIHFLTVGYRYSQTSGKPAAPAGVRSLLVRVSTCGSTFYCRCSVISLTNAVDPWSETRDLRNSFHAIPCVLKALFLEIVIHVLPKFADL